MAILGALAAVCLLPGCTSSSLRCPDDPVAAKTPGRDPYFQPYNSIPKPRLGSIPRPGPLTFFATADPNQLGNHAYGRSPSGANQETDRGIIYTVHGGFIDIAHLRKSADWTVFNQVRIHYALENGWQCIMLPSKEGAVFRIRFNYPASWNTMDASRRQGVIYALSIRMAQRLAVTQTAWHEIATWFGYSATLYPEKPSALTYDDMTSHLLGAKIAGLALHDRSRDYNTAVTWHLKQELDRLGPVSPEQTLKALDMVKNKWWANGLVTKRMLDLGEKTGAIQPWIVPGYPDGTTAAGIPFPIPSLKEVAGQDMSGFEQVDFAPNILQWGKMRRILPGNPSRCQPARDFPLLLQYIRQHESKQ
ncbi:MAG: DUF4056 domain-containing protein [Verrucomicrobiota bacterium]